MEFYAQETRLLFHEIALASHFFREGIDQLIKVIETAELISERVCIRFFLISENLRVFNFLTKGERRFVSW